MATRGLAQHARDNHSNQPLSASRTYGLPAGLASGPCLIISINAGRNGKQQQAEHGIHGIPGRDRLRPARLEATQPQQQPDNRPTLPLRGNEQQLRRSVARSGMPMRSPPHCGGRQPHQIHGRRQILRASAQQTDIENDLRICMWMKVKESVGTQTRDQPGVFPVSCNSTESATAAPS